jgi:multidrug efflux pump subunit AcrA (membrane-fusion protein)
MRNYFRGLPAETLVSILITAVLFAGCGRTETKPSDASNTSFKPEADAIKTTQAKAESRQIPTYIPATGTLTADETSDVAPKVSGKVVSVNANIGQFIRQGAVIARIDDRDARVALSQSRAKLNQALLGVRQAEVKLGLLPNGKFDSNLIPEVRAAVSSYEQAESELKQAEANEKRYRELVETGDVAMITYEQFRTTRDTARSRANNAKQQLEIAINAAKQNNQAIRTAEAAVESAKIDVTSAEKAVADTVVYAPFSGFVSERPTAVGEFVSSSSVIVKLLRTNPIKVQIQVAEGFVPFVGIGRGVSVEIEAYKDRKFGGTVSAVNPSIDPVSRSAIVEAQIENGDNALRSGMFASVRINREGGATGVFVPAEAVYQDQSTQSYRVFVIQDGVAKLRVAQRGPDENGFVQILSGVNGDEMVATSNLAQLYEGAKVIF